MQTASPSAGGKVSRPGSFAFVRFAARTAAAALIVATAALAPASAQTVVLQSAFPSLTFPGPVGIGHAGDGTDRLFVVRQAGYIVVLSNSSQTPVAKTFLDIDAKVESGGELGLLGLAFHPSYESNGYFYVNYTAASPLRTVISRFKVSATNPDSADPASEVVLLEFLQPYTNHNGGQLAFDPDGLLYIGTGDGGSGGDPENRAQDRTQLLGKLLRIDVDTPFDTLQYSIPPTNPYAGNTDGFREEIFAYGLRNPWRFSFDSATGRGWIGDVGQGEWEEVDTMAPGANYGWRLKEGNHCYNPPTDCDTIAGLTDPVWEYAHDGSGGCSITGGYVYRGKAIPSLTGKYLCADYCSGRIWTVEAAAGGTGWAGSLLLDSPYSITSFGVDSRGEQYLCNLGDSRIYRLLPSSPPVPQLRSPGDGATGVPPDTILRWSPSLDAIRYHLQVAPDSTFGLFAVDDTSLTDTSRFVAGLPGAHTFHWRVRARNTVGWSAFTAPWSFTTGGIPGAVVTYQGGWNVVSLPLDVPDGRMDSVFPQAVSPAWRYAADSGYFAVDSLLPGAGYWVKLPSAEAHGFDGTPRAQDTVGVLAGWNLLGGPSISVDVDSVETDPPGIVASGWYAYDGSYVRTLTIDPGRGYWVKCSARGTMVLRATGAATLSAIREF